MNRKPADKTRDLADRMREVADAIRKVADTFRKPADGMDIMTASKTLNNKRPSRKGES